MFCRKCGTQVSDTAAFCPSCGTKVVGVPAPSQAQRAHSASAFSAAASSPSAAQAVKKRSLTAKILLYKALLAVVAIALAALGGTFLLRLFETLGEAVAWFSSYSELFAFLGTLSYLMCGVIVPSFALLSLSPLVGACLHRGDTQRPVAKRSFIFAFLLCLLCIALWICTFLFEPVFEPVLIGNYAVFVYVFNTFGELAPACSLTSAAAMVLLFVARNQCRAANSEGRRTGTQEKSVQGVAESRADGQSGYDEQPRRKSKVKPILIIAGVVIVLAVAASVVAAFAFGVFDTQVETSGTETLSANEETEAETEAETEDEAEAETVALAQDPVALEDAQVGDIVEFGSYQQDDTGTQQAIRWIVLAVEDGRAFLLSEQCLDAMQMCRSSSRATDAQWIDTYISEWLNDDFLEEAFSEDEQASIFNTQVGEDEGTVVYNKIFLLSADDLDSYLEASWRVANATVYAQSRGAYVFDDDGATNWWLRDALNVSSDSESFFLTVYYDGTLNDQGYEATKSSIAVRPALWLAIEGEAEGDLTYG